MEKWQGWRAKTQLFLRSKPPFTLAIWASIIIHVILLSIHFQPELKRFRDQMPALEVMLVNAKTKQAADKPDALAQANLDRGGNTDQDRKMKSALPTPKLKMQQVQMQQSQEARTAAQAAQVQSELINEQQKVADLEKQAQALMTQIKAQKVVNTQPTKAAKASQTELGKQAVKAEQQHKNDAMSASAQEIERLEALIAKQQEAYEKRPKRQFIGARTQEYRFAMYVESWRQKVERIGNMNYPQAAKAKKIYGKLQMSVSIKADGSIEEIRINQSSGHKILDEAAKRIVQVAAPFERFSADIKKDTDILTITRTWTFTQQDAMTTE